MLKRQLTIDDVNKASTDTVYFVDILRECGCRQVRTAEIGTRQFIVQFFLPNENKGEKYTSFGIRSKWHLVHGLIRYVAPKKFFDSDCMEFRSPAYDAMQNGMDDPIPNLRCALYGAKMRWFHKQMRTNCVDYIDSEALSICIQKTERIMGLYIERYCRNQRGLK